MLPRVTRREGTSREGSRRRAAAEFDDEAIKVANKADKTRAELDGYLESASSPSRDRSFDSAFLRSISSSRDSVTRAPTYIEGRALTSLRMELLETRQSLNDIDKDIRRGVEDIESDLTPTSSPSKMKVAKSADTPLERSREQKASKGPQTWALRESDSKVYLGEAAYQSIFQYDDVSAVGGEGPRRQGGNIPTTLHGGSGSLKVSTNVILLFQLQTLKSTSFANFVLSVLSLSFVGLNIAMVAINYLNVSDTDCRDEDSIYVARCGSPTSVWTFHAVEFTSTFLLSVVQACALLFTPRASLSIYENPPVLRFVLIFAVVVSFVTTLLIWFNFKAFEMPAHQIEYSNEVTTSFIDIVMFSALFRKQIKIEDESSQLPQADLEGGTGDEIDEDELLSATGRGENKTGKREKKMGTKNKNQGHASLAMACMALIVALFQLAVYNGLGITEDGERVGEKPAHYCEFILEILSAFITFYFCVDSKCQADREVEFLVFERSDKSASGSSPLSADVAKPRRSAFTRGRVRSDLADDETYIGQPLEYKKMNIRSNMDQRRYRNAEAGRREW